MSPAPVYNHAERRARIRILTRGGQGLAEISRAVGVGQRTVLSVLTSPETDYERDVADLLQGWSPDCMEPVEWADWQRMNSTRALKPCWDCPLDFAVEMRAKDRCNGTPGEPIGRPVETRPVLLERRPEREAFLHQVTNQALIDEPTEEAVDARIAQAIEVADVLYPAPLEEPAMSIDDAPATQDPELALEEVDVKTALELVGFAARVAGEAWTKKLEAAEAAIAADSEWSTAVGKLASAYELVGIGGRLVSASERLEVLGDLVAAAERVIDAGLEDAPEIVKAIATAEEVLDPTSGPADTTSPGSVGPASASAPPPHQQREAEARTTAGLTPRQSKVLAGLQAGKSRADIARELGVVYQSVDGMLEAMAKKGLLPTELMAGLPARFARYATVRS